MRWLTFLRRRTKRQRVHSGNEKASSGIEPVLHRLLRQTAQVADSAGFPMYGPLPFEVALFADGGVAWSSNERPSILDGSRDGVSSAGVTLRVNLAGFAVGQFDFVRPLQRPGQGWILQFNLTPGF